MGTDVSGKLNTAKLKQTGFLYSQDRGTTFIRKAEINLPNYTALYATKGPNFSCGSLYVRYKYTQDATRDGKRGLLLQILSIAFVLETQGLRSYQGNEEENK
jgi:hypothetical protein